jgi:PKD repeat protein
MFSRKIMLFILVILILPVYISSAQYYLRVEYPIAPGFYFAEVNGVKIYDPSQTVYVNAGDSIEGFFDVKVVNIRGGAWITPVIGTASWTRGDFQCITSDAPSGESIQSYHFYLKAPETPGTYYIGIFAGWMYSCAEVASNDHPPQFNDGDDVWDMSQSDWESIISTGSATKYNQPGRAIRIVVQGTTPPPEQVSVDVWTDKGGKGVGNYNGGTYSIGDDITLYCSVNADVDFLKVWVEKPNGTTVLFEGSAKAGTYEFHGKVGEPAGERMLKAYAYKSGQTAKDETKFYAIAANKPPVADFSYSPSNPLAGDKVSFYDRSYDPDGSVVSWHWDFGDGTTSYERNPTHVFSSSGSYTVTLTVKDDKGAEGSISKTVYMGKKEENKPPTAYIDSISPNPAYEGQTISFSGHGYDPDGKITECDWRADGRVLSSSCSFTTSLPPGKYTIYFRVKDDKGAWSKWVYADLVVKEVSTTERLKLLEKIQGIYEEVYKSLDEGKIALDTQITFENMFIDMWKDLIEILGSGDIDSLDTVKKLFEMMIGAIEKLDEEGKLSFLQLRLIELNKYGIKDKINELIKLIEEEKQALRNGDLKRVGEVRDRERRILAEIQVNLGPVKSHISNLMRKYTESLCGQEISEWWKEYSMKKGEKRTRTITLNEESNEIIVSIRVENRPWLFWGDSFKVKVSDPLGLLPTLGVPTEVSVAGDGDILFIAWKDQTKLDSLRKMYKDLNQVAKLTVEVECENLMSFLGSGWFPKEPDVKVIVKTREGCGTVEHPTKYEEYAYNYLNNYITLLEKTAEANLRLLSKG